MLFAIWFFDNDKDEEARSWSHAFANAQPGMN
jgi:hypothetical protein